MKDRALWFSMRSWMRDSFISSTFHAGLPRSQKSSWKLKQFVCRYALVSACPSKFGSMNGLINLTKHTGVGVGARCLWYSACNVLNGHCATMNGYMNVTPAHIAPPLQLPTTWSGGATGLFPQANTSSMVMRQEQRSGTRRAKMRHPGPRSEGTGRPRQ